jgi:hypothetical protein
LINTWFSSRFTASLDSGIAPATESQRIGIDFPSGTPRLQAKKSSLQRRSIQFPGQQNITSLYINRKGKKATFTAVTITSKSKPFDFFATRQGESRP